MTQGRYKTSQKTKKSAKSKQVGAFPLESKMPLESGERLAPKTRLLRRRQWNLGSPERMKMYQEAKSSSSEEQPSFEDVRFTLIEGDYEDALTLFGFNWFKLKEHLAYEQFAATPEEYAERVDTMRGFLAFREVVVDSLLVETLEWLARSAFGAAGEVHIEKIMRGEEKTGYQLDYNGQKVIASAPGSQALTSDYDITFIVPNFEECEIDAVHYFNDRFRKKWKGKASGVVFDTNVYTSGFMSDFAQTKHKSQFAHHIQMYDQFRMKKHILQMALSFLPIRQYFSEREDEGIGRGWKVFKGATKVNLKAYMDGHLNEGEEFMVFKVVDRELDEIFNMTQVLHAETMGKLAAQKKQIERRYPEKSFKLISKIQLNSLAGDELYEHELVRVRELIVERRKLLKDLERMRLKMFRSRKIESLLDKLQSNLMEFELCQGRALVYANEAYYNAGAATHVVKGMQSGGEVELGRQKQMQSLLMNIGYKLQHFEHHLEEGGFGRALVNTAKYGQRVRDVVMRGSEGFKTPFKKVEGTDEFFDPKLYEALDEDLELLDIEERLIKSYKKSKTLVSPSAKEAAAAKDFHFEGSVGLTHKGVERHYMHMAQNVLGPYYLDKFSRKGLRLWGEVK
ncbi:hypothetical protein [Aureibacter tunicatorum]|uniref:Uncharacterized protein n=1 Tax=Aureibacter tunicatorum TaxID=866807 RepID=A0AAE3XPS2_9BACT|nr:hypothetical protein [Aureibacter tunicatorum]MDR6239804.1 hypothetical protein [Aureibacter tunicatorum]BDD04279.1 hypothetical protein AUTU_17620 [Aureibacter tunicatorum]